MIHELTSIHAKLICYYLDHFAVFSLMAEGVHQMVHLYHITHLLL